MCNVLALNMNAFVAKTVHTVGEFSAFISLSDRCNIPFDDIRSYATANWLCSYARFVSALLSYGCSSGR